jgi:hypothetical protein
LVEGDWKDGDMLLQQHLPIEGLLHGLYHSNDDAQHREMALEALCRQGCRGLLDILQKRTASFSAALDNGDWITAFSIGCFILKVYCIVYGKHHALVWTHLSTLLTCAWNAHLSSGVRLVDLPAFQSNLRQGYQRLLQEGQSKVFEEVGLPLKINL